VIRFFNCHQVDLDSGTKSKTTAIILTPGNGWCAYANEDWSVPRHWDTTRARN